jgi:hypothetical protein
MLIFRLEERRNAKVKVECPHRAYQDAAPSPRTTAAMGCKSQQDQRWYRLPREDLEDLEGVFVDSSGSP